MFHVQCPVPQNKNMDHLTPTNCNTFHLDNYSVLTSLKEDTIYVQLKDMVTGMCYEGNFDQEDLRLMLQWSIMYQLVCGCFSKQEGYTVEFCHTPGLVQVRLQANLGGYLPVETALVLKGESPPPPPHTMEEDNPFMERLAQMEQSMEELKQQNQALAKQNHQLQHQHMQLLPMFNNLVNRLSGIEECGVVLYEGCKYGVEPFVKINAETVILPHSAREVYLNRIQYFYRLKKLDIRGNCAFVEPYGGGGGGCGSLKTEDLSSNTLEHLIIQHSNCHISLDGLDRLPSLKKLELNDCPHLQPFVEILQTYPHTIRDIAVTNCQRVNQAALTDYCTQNNIRLSLY